MGWRGKARAVPTTPGSAIGPSLRCVAQSAAGDRRPWETSRVRGSCDGRKAAPTPRFERKHLCQTFEPTCAPPSFSNFGGVFSSAGGPRADGMRRKSHVPTDGRNSNLPSSACCGRGGNFAGHGCGNGSNHEPTDGINGNAAARVATGFGWAAPQRAAFLSCAIWASRSCSASGATCFSGVGVPSRAAPAARPPLRAPGGVAATAPGADSAAGTLLAGAEDDWRGCAVPTPPPWCSTAPAAGVPCKGVITGTLPCVIGR
mmetsp:Transcript_27387/g.77766  ORF Transcript_27387/g.77766 Transcript_27387/m.77766 type:complete len:259 (-) Transcript_27387:236-1012(-)